MESPTLSTIPGNCQSDLILLVLGTLAVRQVSPATPIFKINLLNARASNVKTRVHPLLKSPFAGTGTSR
jgi:hypothetical protein